MVLPQVKLDGRWCSDGGLLNALPVWAAVELGATRIVGLHVLPEFPVEWMQPAVWGFRAMFGHKPPLPVGVELTTLLPGARLGSLRDALEWKESNIERWLEQGARDASEAVTRKSFPL
jgi:predicted acylesterase/phospholipase RssA